MLGSGLLELVISVVGTLCLIGLFGGISAIAGLRARAPALRLTPTGLEAIDAFGHVTALGWTSIEAVRVEGQRVVIDTRDGQTRVGRVVDGVKAFVEEADAMIQRRRLPASADSVEELRSIEAVRARPETHSSAG